jgi:hypothetical protein
MAVALDRTLLATSEMTPSPLPLDVPEALRLHAEVLEQRRIRYAVIGGLATGVRARSRFTEDVDLLLEVPQLQLPALLDELGERGFAFGHATAINDWNQGHMLRLQYGEVPVDWLKPVLPCLAHAIDRATPVTWIGQRIRVATAEDLIVMKMLSGRPQDDADIHSLLSVNRDRLDLPQIRAELAATLPDDPVLDRFEELARAYYLGE